jgi:DMSO/TMAO reductase YedYZ molybdopterin-dependent catalytic subunit
MLQFLTPTEDFYRFSNGPVPRQVATETASLLVGSDARPVAIPWSRVLGLAHRKIVRTLQCDGNGYEGGAGGSAGCQAVPAPDEDRDHPPPENWTWRFGGIGNAEWSVLSVAELFRSLGVDTSGPWLKAAGRDGYVRYFPREVALDPDFCVAVGMNGQPLPHGHGAPGRLLVPGQYGAMSIKWLSDLTFGPMEDTRTFDGGSPNHYPIKPLAFATAPLDHAKIPPGEVELLGAAFAGLRPVKEVILWTDPAKPWMADLVDPPRANVWTRWRSRARLPQGRLVLHVCCVDDRGAHSSFQSPFGDAEGYGGIHVLHLTQT